MSVKSSYLYIILVVFIVLVILSYNVGYKKAITIGYKNGYAQGQVKLALEITKELNITVNNNTKEKYTLFRNIKDITLYIYEKNNIKTIASWEEK